MPYIEGIILAVLLYEAGHISMNLRIQRMLGARLVGYYTTSHTRLPYRVK